MHEGKGRRRERVDGESSRLLSPARDSRVPSLWNRLCRTDSNTVYARTRAQGPKGIHCGVHLTIKATYLEVVSDLSTSAFLAAFERFATRRGMPATVYSDNATNFQGARNELATVWNAAIRDPNLKPSRGERSVGNSFLRPLHISVDCGKLAFGASSIILNEYPHVNV